MTDAYCYMTYLSPTVMVAAVLLFLLFERMEVDGGARKILKILAPTSFGVYLIHDNLLIRNYYMLRKFSDYADLPWSNVIIAVIATAVIIYAFCTCLEMIRRSIFEKLKVKEAISGINDIIYFS